MMAVKAGKKKEVIFVFTSVGFKHSFLRFAY